MTKLSLLLLVVLLSPKAFSQDAVDEESIETIKTAALIYKLYFYVDFPSTSDTPQYCFVGTNSFNVAKVLTKQQMNQQLNRKIKISKWQSPSEIDPKMCNIIYSAPTQADQKEIFLELSKLALTVSDSVELRETGHISSITYQDQEAVLSFSRKNLKRSAILVNSQLIRHSELRP